MKFLQILCLVASFALVAGCESKGETTVPEGDGATGDAIEAKVVTAEIPAEAKAEAAKEITADNAEAEADKLEKEIEADNE